MQAKQYRIVAIIVLSLSSLRLIGTLTSLAKNDPFPLYTSIYPYDFLAQREKIEGFYKGGEIYEEDRFRLSISIFRQSARCANDIFRRQTEIGNLPEGFGLNFSALFFDPVMARKLATVLNIPTQGATCAPIFGLAQASSDTEQSASNTEICCFEALQDMANQDRNREYGVVSIPIFYRKYGVRFQGDFLLIDTCFDAVGLTVQAGISDVRQTVSEFIDLTCTASAIACPAHQEPSSLAGCTPNGPEGSGTCCNQPCCIGFSCDCKKLISDQVIKQRTKVGQLLGYDFCNTYNEVGPEDLRIELFWRHLYDLNPDNLEDWPRVLFVPFAKAGVIVPMTKKVSASQVFGVPLDNNGHAGAGASLGFSLNFLDTIDIDVEGGFTHFFKQEYCNYPLTTSTFESGIFPYRADYKLHPGTNWHVVLGMHAYHFIDRLSVWVQYVQVNHDNDHIELCRSLIPEDSIYFPSVANQKVGNGQDFLVEAAECVTKWESHMVNVGFTYDISPYVIIGALWQAPIKRRNAYRSSTILLSASMTY